jgi:hypothetical protein
MPDIVISEAVFEDFLKSLHSKIAAEMQAFRARLDAHEAVYRAQLGAGLESKMRKAEEVDRRVRAVEDRMRASEEELERKMKAAEDQIARKRREAEDEIARLRQLERIRHTYEAERDPESRLQ